MFWQPGVTKNLEKNRGMYPQEQDLVLQWGNRKRMRCVRVQVKSGMEVKVKRTAFRVERAEMEAAQTPRQNFGLNRASNSQAEAVKYMAAEDVNVRNNSGHACPDKTHTRAFNNNNGWSSAEETNKISMEADTMQEKSSCLEVFVWPKVVITLSSKEREEDFMAIKGSKLPQRPKKRAKFIQRNLLVVSPGSWLCDLSQERYEVHEKKNNRKRPGGLKAMGNMDSDSD